MVIVGATLLLGACAALFVSLGLVRTEVNVMSVVRRRPKSAATQVFADNDIHTLGWMRAIAVPMLIARAERNLALAGRKAGWTLRRLMLVKIVLATVAGLATFTLWSSAPTPRGFLLFVLVTIGAYFFPDLWLNSRAAERQAEIERQLPDVLDQCVIAIESGLSFEAALAKVAESGEGPLVEEFRRTLQDMRLGMSRRAAYMALSGRTTVVVLQRFCRHVTQAEEFGVSLAQVVRNLAHDMRIKRKYLAEEKAQKIPVKMIFPMAVCFMPVLFVVILFPTFYGLNQNL